MRPGKGGDLLDEAGTARGGMAGVFVSTDDSEEGVSEHGQGDPARPRGEAADLVFVQSGQALSCLESLLHPPSRPGDAHQRGQRHRGRRPAAVVGQFTGGAVAADQQLVAAGSGFGQVDDGPFVETVPLGAGSGRQLLPGPLGDLRGQGVRAQLPRAGGDFMGTGDGEHVADPARFQRGRSFGLPP
ncbi:hypothetical protein GCM10010251_93760 [Streptomyces aurantiogriseus]|uniref:Uncharacterized protein n=1 Tax=Streptomyces aurantiogriseus TaxID=66870 RepID=A0A918FP07_9ACTN|nr:hypothetical protein GCM10010251_93760 [Streptomyces aurantiogriseus]